MTKPEKASRILFFTSIVFVILACIFFLWLYIDIAISMKQAGGNQDSATSSSGVGIGIALIFLLVYGSILFFICTVLNIISFILQKKVTNPSSKKWNIITGINICIPALVELILFILFRTL